MSLTVTFTGSGGFGGTGGANAVPSLRVLLFSNAAVPASQNGAVGNSGSAYDKAITTSAGSFGVAAMLGPSTTSFSAASGQTILDNIQDSTNNVRHGSSISSAVTTAGSHTIGSSTTWGTDGGCAVAEIKSNGSTLTRKTANEPAVVSGAAGDNAVTSSAFTPPGSSLIVALVDGLCTGGTVTDSSGLTWTPLEEFTADGYCGVWIAQVPAGLLTVTATPTGATGAGLRLYVLTDAIETGGNTLTQSGSGEGTGSFTPNASKSLVLWSVYDFFSNTSFTAIDANNTVVDNLAGSGTRFGDGKYTGTVTASTPLTFGVTNVEGASGAYVAAVQEIESADGVTSPSIDSSSPTVVSSGSGSTAKTTDQFTPPAGAVLVAVCISGGSTSNWAMTDTLGLTWTKRADATNLRYYTATVPSGVGTGSVKLKKMGLSGTGSSSIPITATAFNTAATPGATTVSVPAPLDVLAGDLLMIWVTDASTTITFSISGSSGWTTVGPTTGQNCQGTLLYKTADSTDVALCASRGSYILTPSAAHSTAGVIIGARGYHFDPTPPDAGQYVSSTATSLPNTGITTVSNGDQLLALVVDRIASGTPPVITLPSGFATLVAQSNSSASAAANNGVMVGIQTQTTAGATGTKTATAASSADGGMLIIGLSNAASNYGSVAMHKMAIAASAVETEFGTVAVHMHKMAVSASARETDKGTVAVHLKKMGVAASGSVYVPGGVSVHMHKMGIAASGQETDKGTVAVHMHKMGVAVSGKPKWVAAVAVHMHKMGIAASAVETESGTVTVHMHKMGIAASGQETDKGTVTVYMHKMGVAASGTESGTDAGTVAVHMHKMVIAASARETERGTVSVQLKKMHISAAAEEVGTIVSVQLKKMSLSAAGRGTTSGPVHISMHKMSVQVVGKDTGIVNVHIHKFVIHGTNIGLPASSMFIFTAV